VIHDRRTKAGKDDDPKYYEREIINSGGVKAAFRIVVGQVEEFFSPSPGAWEANMG